MKVEFTQYLRPDGRKKLIHVELPINYAPFVNAIRNAGLRLTAEVLTTNEVSLAIQDDERGDFRSEVVPNGPGVVEAAGRLVSSFSHMSYDLWRLEASNE